MCVHVTVCSISWNMKLLLSQHVNASIINKDWTQQADIQTFSLCWTTDIKCFSVDMMSIHWLCLSALTCRVHQSNRQLWPSFTASSSQVQFCDHRGYTCTCTCTYISVYICVYLCICVYMCMSLWMYICMLCFKSYFIVFTFVSFILLLLPCEALLFYKVLYKLIYYN